MNLATRVKFNFDEEGSILGEGALMDTKRCKIHYRRLRRDNGQFPAMSLADAVAQALNKKVRGRSVRSSVENRMAAVAGGGDYRRFLNNMHTEKNLVFGDVCLFSPGQLQALLELSEDKAQPTLDEIMRAWNIAEQRAPDGMEYLHGITYWMIVDDHFYQIQHVSLQCKAVEEYLTWLLRDQTAVIGSGQYVELQSQFDRAQIGDDLGDLKSIEIGGLIPETVREGAIDPQSTKVVEVDAKESIGEKIAQTFQAAKKIMVDLLGDVEAQKILDSMPNEAALEVTVNIAYRAKKRKFQKEFMSNLEAGLRNIPDGEIRVRGRDGEIKGDDARLSADMTIKKHGSTSSLLDLEDVLAQMKEVHRRFLFDGRIVAERA